MYRLLKIRKMYQTNLQVVSHLTTNLNTTFQSVGRTCHLCKQLHDLQKVLIRNRSTNPDPITSVRKKRIRKSKKYAELLVVTENSTSEKKASVKKFNQHDLFALAQQPTVGLGELHKIKAAKKRDNRVQSVIESVSNFHNVNTIHDELLEKDEFDSDAINQQLRLIGNSPLVEEPECSVSEDFDVEVHREEVTLKLKEKLSKETSIIKTLCAYIEVCNGVNEPEKGLAALKACRSRSQRPNDIPPIKNIAVYNTLLKGFATSADIANLELVLTMAKEENLSLNIKSYAAILECFGNAKNTDQNMKTLLHYVGEMEIQGITFNKIFNHNVFTGRQRESVLKAVRYIDRHFVPNYYPPRVQYKTEIVEDLNHPKQLEMHGTNAKRRTDVQHQFKSEQLIKLLHTQLDIEKDGYVTIKSIDVKSELTDTVSQYRKSFDKLLKKWESGAMNAFKRDLAVLNAKSGLQHTISPYLRCLQPDMYIKIIMNEVKRLAQGSESYSPTVPQLHREIGNCVYSKYRILRRQQVGILDKVISVHEDYLRDYSHSHRPLLDHPEHPEPLNPRQKWQTLEYNCIESGPTIAGDHNVWPPTILTEIGRFLYNIIIYDLKIDVNVVRNNNKHKNNLPAFYTVFRSQGRVIKEEIKPHPVLIKLYRGSAPETLTFLAQEVPMICPPVPWTSVSNGGYMIAHSEVVRLPIQAFAQRQRMLHAPPEELYPSLDALNQLASVPWCVNNPVLDLIIEIFNSGGSSKLDVPEPPSSLPVPPSVTPEMDKAQRFAVFKEKMQARRKKGEMYSLWCDALYRLSLANHFRDQTFWLPHNMDFRGRVYPVPPHLNHLGSDLARSMLIFAEKRPLGPEGLKWLKIHLINLTGLKKRDSIDERYGYAEEILPKILDSAEKPLTGDMWWSKSDEPWQTLACCMEIAAAIESGNPETFKSGFPVHQDGSCNGLQHYAALGRDYVGACSVNLVPAPRPQDVYNAVANLVEERRAADAAMGHEIAKVLEGFVKRKVIKQTVMTTVYGVTRYGARLQIAKQLKDIDAFPKDYVWSASSYLTSRTFESLRSMFTSTREIQDWFTECARLISAVSGKNVEWVTPLGFPVVQPYNKYKKYEISSTRGRIDQFAMDLYEKPNVMKQKNAFPPNFIHSLDSSHMMLTSLFCERAGITYVSVHDCYWTHPATVHMMNKICREQFVALHSLPILENLSNFLSEKYSYSDDEFEDDGSVVDLTRRKLNRALKMLPKTGDFDISEVLSSIYFFS